jgi:MscS family membrane protein
LIGERAFKIGDRISVAGQEGVVEQVGFRSTRLRTPGGSLLTIPNAVIATAAIDNRGSGRRFTTAVLLSPDTPPARLLEFRDGLRAWLAEQPQVAGDEVDVHLHQVTADGVELSVGVSLTSGVPADETRVREALSCEILRRAAALGVGVGPCCWVPRAA